MNDAAATLMDHYGDFCARKKAKNVSSGTTELSKEKCEERLEEKGDLPWEHSSDAASKLLPNKRISALLKKIITRWFSQFTQ